MADNVLKAIIDVSAPGAKETFDDVAKMSAKVNEALKILGQQGVLNAKSLADAIGQIKVAISKTSDPAELQKLNIILSALQNKAKELPQTFDKVHVSSLRASSSALNLSHSLGLLGSESSHLTHGIESILFAFEQMHEKTGSATGALNGLATTIGTGLGIGLAIQAVSFLAEELLGTEDAAKASEEALANLAEEMDKVKGSVKSLSDELQFANQIGGLDIKIRGASNLTDLREQSFAQREFTQDLVKQMEELKKIRDQIDKDENLSDEDRKKARADVNKEISDLNDKFIDSERKQEILYKQIALQKVEDQKEANEKAIKDRKDYLRRLKEQMDFEEGLWKGLQEGVLGLQKELERIVKADQANRARQQDIITGQLVPEIHLGESDRDKVNKEIVDRLSKKPLIVPIPVDIDLVTRAHQIQTAIDNINQIIKDALNEGLSTFGEGLGEALAGGDIQKAFQNFAKVVGGAVKAIGQQLIVLGTAALAAKVALQNLFKNPALQIAAGVALVAIGSAMQHLLSGGVKGFAGGGIVPGRGVPILVGEKGPEIFIPDTGGRIIPNNQSVSSGIAASAGGQTHKVVFEIAGQKLIGVLALANQQLGRLT